MAYPTDPNAKTEKLLSIILPHLKQLCRDAPEHGEITITAIIHDGDIGRIRVGAEVSRAIAPRSGR
jgi:hypothetical protein